MGTNTPNYNLYKPANGETGWGDDVNTSTDTVDTTMKVNEDAITPNTAHRAGDGSDHADVATNTVHSTGDGSDHSDVALNNTHRTSDGSQHTFVDQSVVSGSSPTFDGTNFTGMAAANVNITDVGGYLTATEVEAAFQEIVPEIDANTTHAGLAAPHRLINDSGASGTDLWSASKISSVVNGADWQASVIDFYDPTASTPPGPGTGDRYIASATANGWTDTYIYEYNGATWDETVSDEGMATWNETEDIQYTFNGTAWVKFGSTVDHLNLQNIGTNAHSVIDTHVDGNGLDHSQVTSNAVSTLNFVIDGGGAAITTGIKGDIEIPFACTINQVTLLADQSTTTVIDIWKDTYANYPATVADTITAAAIPTITAGLKDQDATLTGWTTSITAGDCLRFNVDSNDNAERVTISLKVTKT